MSFFILSVYLKDVKSKDEKTFRRQMEMIPSGYCVKRAMKHLIFSETIDHFLRHNQCSVLEFVFNEKSLRRD